MNDPEKERLLFGLLIEGVEECLELAALSKEQAVIWLDGLRVLMGKEMEEVEAHTDLEMLLK